MATVSLPQGIEIFKAGSRTDDAGNTHVITAADVAACAAGYDPALHEAPLTVGHPESNRPAYGWVSGLRVPAPGALAMNHHQVEAQFAELVATGRLKKRSSSFYPPNHPQNPKPGVWYLRHVAFLGAQPPAVKGLKDVSFAACADDGAINFSEAIDPPTTQEPDMTAELQTQLDAANAAAAADKARAEQAERRLQELEDQHKAARRTANVAFAEAQVQAGRVLPHAKDMLVTTLEALADAAPVDFSEGGTTKKVSPADWLKGQITAGKPLISFSEHAPGKVIPGDHVTEATSDQDFDKAVRARMAKDTCSYSEAASKLTAGFTS